MNDSDAVGRPLDTSADQHSEVSQANITRRRMLALLGASGAAVALGAKSASAMTTLPAGGDGHSPGPLQTRLTREYGVRFPFVGAGMGFVAMPSLVAAVSNAGGIGVLGNGIEPPPSTQLLIQQIKKLTRNIFGIDFLVDQSAFGPIVTDDHIDVCIAEGVKLVVFHMNVPTQDWVDRLHASGARVWMQTGSTAVALEAVKLGVDAIVAQGVEAGGHNKSTTPLKQVLPEIVDTVRPVMVLAAGGIADGDSAAKAFARGADGVWVGTRLVMSTEAYAHPEYQRRILAARIGDSSVITTMFGPEYPDRPYRALRNRVVNEWAGREDEIPNPPPPPDVIGNTVLFPLTIKQPYAMPKFSAIVPTPETTGDFEEMGMAAGTESARRIDRIKPAAQIVVEMMTDAERRLRDLIQS